MGERLLGESSIDFPPYIFQPSDGGNGFPTRASATDMMSHNSGFRLVHPPPRSLRSGAVLPSPRKSSVPVRFPSTASATTVATSFHCYSDNVWSPRSDIALADKYEVPFLPDGYQMAPQRVPSLVGSQRPGFRLFSSPYSRKDSGDSPSLGSAASLPSSPVTPNTPYFVSKPVIAATTSPLLHAKSRPDVVSNDTPDAISDVERSPKADEPIRRHPSLLRRKSRDARPTPPPPPFNSEVELTSQQLQHAWTLPVLDQDGNKTRLGDLCQSQRTCVIFIRYFWCAFCMDYMRSIAEQVEPERLARAGVKLIVISNGSPALIPSYKRIFNFPFPVYTDPSCQLYHALGMTLRTSDLGPDSERGDYIRHGVAGSMAAAMKNVVRARMPLYKNGGDVKQLGGEFVFGPGVHCSYVSRMHNARSHTPIRDVLAAAGVQFEYHSRNQTNPFYANEDQWMKDREVELRKIQARKGKRRGFMGEYRRSESTEHDRGSLDV